MRFCYFVDEWKGWQDYWGRVVPSLTIKTLSDHQDVVISAASRGFRYLSMYKTKELKSLDSTKNHFFSDDSSQVSLRLVCQGLITHKLVSA